MTSLDEARSLMQEEEEERLSRLAFSVADMADGILLALPQPTVEGFMEGDPWIFLFKAAVSRQVKSLRLSGFAFAELQSAHLLGGFVRKSFEEFVWLKYLQTLPVDTRRKVVHAFAAFELGILAQGQIQTFGAKKMRKMGFEKKLIDHLHERAKVARNELAEEAASLDWPQGEDGKFSPPSVAALVPRVKLDKEYQDIYGASSRAVHFSISESLRRASISDKGITIFDQSLSAFEQNCFVIDRQISLLGELLIYVHSEVDDVELPMKKHARSEPMEFYAPGKTTYLNMWDFRHLEP
ncbi:DUF5677 domain-containing protein [Streptomyces sp. NPDC057579]|uniref:DUF5677 domain-containing protein n=1 Tax=Streptomyces sp. NPDC057579 TaxID=3346172 RepID=UPI0036C20112